MNIKSLAKSDLNLIVVFQVLMDERNVTRAAEKIHISQPAMSKALNRLRELFDDPLFTRTAYGIVPTPKAQELYKHVPEVMGRIDRMINPADFEPHSYSGKFRIACGDQVGNLVARLFFEAHELGGNMRFEQISIQSNYIEELRSGHLDFAIHTLNKVPEDFIAESLRQVSVKVAMRKSHPLGGKKSLSIKDFIKYPHVRLTHPEGRRVVDLMLAAKNLRRNILLVTEFSHIARNALLKTDCLQVVGEPLFEISEPDNELHLADLPKALWVSPVEVKLLQHLRTHHSNAHTWLKDRILELMR